MIIFAVIAIVFVFPMDYTRNQAFKFRVQVVDTDGAVIENATVNAKIIVDYTSTPIPIPWSSPRQGVAIRGKTDARGWFELEGRGVGLYVGCTKSGFVMVKPNLHYMLEKDHPNLDVEKPALIVMKREIDSK